MDQNETGILDPRHRQQSKLTPEQREHAKFIRRRELNDLAAVMETVEGRRFIWRLLTISRVFSKAFTGNSNTFYILGMQDLGKEILSDAHLASLKLYRQAEDEAAAEQDEEELAKKKGQA